MGNSHHRKKKAADARKRAKQYLRKPQVINLPEHFSLAENYESVVGAIDDLRNCEGAFSVNFSAMKKVSVAAALMLAAEMHICVLKASRIHGTPQKLKVWGNEWHKNAGIPLREMGFFDLLQIKPVMMGSQSGLREVFIKFVSDTSLTPLSISKIIDNVERAFATETAPIPPEIRLPMLAGMGEAILNTYHHAGGGELSRWWISASVNRDTNELKVICYDRGKTIPKTLPGSQLWLSIMNSGNTEKDEDMISAALKTRKSSTKKEHRGYGLQELRNLIDANGQGVMEVYSRKGMVEYKRARGKKEADFNAIPLVRELRGTLVVWSIIPKPLQEKK